MDVVIDRLQPEDVEQEARLRALAFQRDLGPYYDPDRPSVDRNRVHVAKAGGKVVAAVSVLPFGQWFGGAALAMGGVAGVAVAPEARGHGLARRLMNDAVTAMHERGEIISSLYPTTSTLYRASGYEFAGRWERTRVEISELARLPAPTRPVSGRRLTVEALPAGQLQRMRPLYDALAATTNGWLARTDLFWDRLNYFMNPDKTNTYGYVILADDEDEPVGKVVGGLTIGHTAGRHQLKYDLEVGGPFATDGDVLASALRLVADHGTTADRATLSLPVETLATALPGAVLDHRDSWLWMLRLIDVGPALTTRGYNPNVTARVRFDLSDDLAPWNRGRWAIDVADGRATVDGPSGTTSSGAGSVVELDIQTLSCLFTGFVGPWDLARAGRLPAADRPTLEALAAIFAGPPPRLVDFF
ncbi:MAG: GNAT family N-acetyltransferase [Acidimicrobiales bacterium]